MPESNKSSIALAMSVVLVVLTGCTDVAPGPSGKIDTVLVQSAGDYLAWPAVMRTSGGDIVVFYTNTDEHMAPNGRIDAIRSADDGRSWSIPYTVYDTPLDERESGVTSLSDGSLLLHVWSTQHSQATYQAMGPGSYHDSTVDGWLNIVATPEYLRASDQAGGSVLRSVDGGRNWSKPVPGPDTIHGGIQLSDGRIAVASYRRSRDFVTVHVANDWTGPWSLAAEMRSPQPDSLRFGEPSIAQLPSGRVVVMMRATTIPYNDSDDRCFLWQVVSDDGAITFSEPVKTPLWGFPPHLLTLKDGRLLVTYGYRRPPFGQRAAISNDGVTWDTSDETILRADAPNKDLGYPASVELTDGRILTVYYQSHASDTLRPPQGPLPGRHKPDILATIWRAGPSAESLDH